MKKSMLVVVALVAVSFLGCKKSNPADEVKDALSGGVQSAPESRPSVPAKVVAETQPETRPSQKHSGPPYTMEQCDVMLMSAYKAEQTLNFAGMISSRSTLAIACYLAHMAKR